MAPVRLPGPFFLDPIRWSICHFFQARLKSQLFRGYPLNFLIFHDTEDRGKNCAMVNDRYGNSPSVEFGIKLRSFYFQTASLEPTILNVDDVLKRIIKDVSLPDETSA
jgi:hypothetical protein